MLSKFWKSTTAFMPKDEASLPVEDGDVIEMPRGVAVACSKIIVATTGQQIIVNAERWLRPAKGQTPFDDLLPAAAITACLSYYEAHHGLPDAARIWVQDNIDLIDAFLANAAKTQRLGDNSPMPTSAQEMSGTTAVMVFLQAGYEREQQTRHG